MTRVTTRNLGGVTGTRSQRQSADLARTWLLRLARYLVLIGGALVFVIPLIWLISTSLKPEAEVFLMPPSLLGSRIELINYPAALEKFPFLRGLANTLVIIIGVEAGRLFSASLTAFVFARLRFPGRGPLFLLVLSTMMLPYHVTLIPQYLMFRDFGWLGTNLPLIVPAFFGGGAFYIFMLRQFFMQIPREYDEAAAIDGCSRLGIYWRIILPMSVPALGAVAIFTFLGEWNDFFAPMIYLIREESYTLALAFEIWQSTTANQVSSGGGYKGQPYNHILAIAALITLIPMLVFFFAQRYFIQGIVISGIKG